MQRNTKVLSVLIVLLIGFCGWSFIRHAVQSVRIAFAEEQTEIFGDMTNGVQNVLKKEPPDVRSAVEYLEYASGYYPSGTKQVTGSHLDRIVERAREGCVREIIAMLRVATGEDLGDSPEPWIERYGR